MVKFSPCFIIVLLTIWACGAKHNKKNERITGYNLKTPDVILHLPHMLNEISGLTYIDSSTFACIQDEKGILFLYDINKEEIIQKYTFNMDGDYEGITRVDKTIFVLRSDGILFKISDFQSKNFRLDSIVTGIPANNNEGLCYDFDNNRLLIACKSKIGKGHDFKDKRVIYGFNLKTNTMNEEPVFDIDLQSVKRFALKENVKVHVKSKKKGKVADPDIKMLTSDIGIHPITKKLFLLSAIDHMLFIFDRSGTIEHIENLNAEIFNQSEGITFRPNGELLITNEGNDKKATLLRFKYML